MFLFLGFKTGLVVSSLIPTTILITVALMSIFRIGMDQVSLAALMIALGMLVDNAIVMCESTVVSMESGKSAYDAAMESAAELKVPLLTSSLTTIAAFMPFKAESNMGEYVSPLPKVVGITLLTSWVITMTFIPILCTYFLKIEKKEDDKENPYFEKFFNNYKSFLLLTLKHKAIGFAGFFFLILTSFYLFGMVRKGFFPPQVQPLFTMEIDLPQGTPVKYSNYVIMEFDKYIKRITRKRRERRNCGLVIIRRKLRSKICSSLSCP